MSQSPAANGVKTLAVNRKARHDYFVLDRCEAGIALVGTEVKSARQGNVNLQGSYAGVTGSGVLLAHGINIAAYEHGNRFNHDPVRPRPLLLHRREIARLKADVEQQGHTLIPLSLYLSRGRVKVELGLCRGKQQSDRREDMKRKTAHREAERAVADARRDRARAGR